MYAAIVFLPIIASAIAGLGQRFIGARASELVTTGALFVSAGGYHHHLGLNVWGRPRQPHAPGSLGLAGVTWARAGDLAPRELHDPDRIALRIEPLSAAALEPIG